MSRKSLTQLKNIQSSLHKVNYELGSRNYGNSERILSELIVDLKYFIENEEEKIDAKMWKRRVKLAEEVTRDFLKKNKKK